MAADPAALTEHAPAKVNLYLHLCGQREDGYHLLDSLAVFPSVGDTIIAEAGPELSLRIIGPEAGSLTDEGDNLVLRAARELALSINRQPEVSLTLEKRLPVASGIGGGSSDAAATLRLLSKAWDCQPPDDLALALGADVPVCACAPKSMRMLGIGEVLDPINGLPGCGILLVNPRVEVPTGAVFKGVADKNPPAGTPMPDRFAGFADFIEWLTVQRNDLQPAAEAICPEIGTVLDALSEAPLARMSGSGATCFALYETTDDAEHAAQFLRQQAPDWWIAPSSIGG